MTKTARLIEVDDSGNSFLYELTPPAEVEGVTHTHVRLWCVGSETQVWARDGSKRLICYSKWGGGLPHSTAEILASWGGYTEDAESRLRHKQRMYRETPDLDTAYQDVFGDTWEQLSPEAKLSAAAVARKADELRREALRQAKNERDGAVERARWEAKRRAADDFSEELRRLRRAIDRLLGEEDEDDDDDDTEY